MSIETILYVSIGLLTMIGVFDIGYRFGRVQGLKEAQASSSFRLAVLAQGAQTPFEKLVSSS